VSRWTIELVFEVNQHAKYLYQMSFSSKVNVRTHTHTQTRQTASPGPLKWSVKYSRNIAPHSHVNLGRPRATWNLLFKKQSISFRPNRVKHRSVTTRSGPYITPTDAQACNGIEWAVSLNVVERELKQASLVTRRAWAVVRWWSALTIYPGNDKGRPVMASR